MDEFKSTGKGLRNARDSTRVDALSSQQPAMQIATSDGEKADRSMTTDWPEPGPHGPCTIVQLQDVKYKVCARNQDGTHYAA